MSLFPWYKKNFDVFRISVWNNHTVRKQKGKELPTGVPEHIYICPEQYGGEKCGIPVTDQQLQEVAELYWMLMLTFWVKIFTKIARHIPNTENIEPRLPMHIYI